MPTKTVKAQSINKRRLINELLVIGGIMLVIFAARFLPWLMTQHIPGFDPYAKYQDLVKAVENYDYSKGPSTELETRLAAATASIRSDPVKYFFNQKAKAIYYLEIGNYQTSIAALDIAINFVPIPPELAALYDLYVKNYTALDQPDEANHYLELRHDLPV